MDGESVYVEGQVRNVGEQALSGVIAVVEHFSVDDRWLASSSAPLAPATVEPGQTAAFKAVSRQMPEMSKYKVGFRLPTGETVSTTYLAQQ